MKTSRPSGLAKPRGPNADCHSRPTGAWRPFLPVRASASTSPARRGQSKCVVKFAIAQLITNKPVTLTGYLRFPVAAGLVQAQRRAREAVVVHPGSSRDGAGAWVGSGCVVLHRSGGSSSSERHPETRAASDASARRLHAICDNLVFAGRLAADRVCRLAARPHA